MTDREWLTALLMAGAGDCLGKGGALNCSRLADYLLEHGVIVLPADVVEVVRCKDCAIPHNRFTGCPKLNGLIPPENHFCSFGERKEGDTE